MIQTKYNMNSTTGLYVMHTPIHGTPTTWTVGSRTFTEVLSGAVYYDTRPLVSAVHKPFSFDEADIAQAEQLVHVIDDDKQQWVVQAIPEGTLLRVYWCRELARWCTSTTGCTNAYKSYWGADQSFGTIFNMCLGKFYPRGLLTLYQQLDKRAVYYFWLETTRENRIVSKRTDPLGISYVTFLGTMPLQSVNKADFVFAHDTPTILPEFKRLAQINFDSFETLATEAAATPVAIQLIHKTRGVIIKIVNALYGRQAAIRGNDPHLFHRYLELTMHNRVDDRAEFDKLYSEHALTFALRYYRFLRFCSVVKIDALVSQVLGIDMTDNTTIHELVTFMKRYAPVDIRTDLTIICNYVLAYTKWQDLERFF